jgi:hypothetical protein
MHIFSIFGRLYHINSETDMHIFSSKYMYCKTLQLAAGPACHSCCLCLYIYIYIYHLLANIIPYNLPQGLLAAPVVYAFIYIYIYLSSSACRSCCLYLYISSSLSSSSSSSSSSPLLLL